MTEGNHERPIAVGDLVVVIGPSKCPLARQGDDLGHTFKVISITPTTSNERCATCGSVHGPFNLLYAEDLQWNFPLYRLKRIPPLSELWGSKTDEPMKEPA